MADLILMGSCFLLKRAVAGALAGVLIGMIPFAITKSIKIFGITIPTVAVVSAIIGFEIQVC